ncbi:MAG: DUF5979 domain-containing protein [Caulobacter sp.]|nr:DUF5979 domain-containing protein [Caulobacter sp.]
MSLIGHRTRLARAPGRRRAWVAAAGPALGLWLAASAALAMTITAPTGATLPKVAPINVQWTSTPGPGNIEIRLERQTPSFLTSIVAGSVPNTGQASVSFPAAWVCDPSATYRIRVFRYQSTATSWTPLDQGYGPFFKVSCATKPGGGFSGEAPSGASAGVATAVKPGGGKPSGGFGSAAPGGAMTGATLYADDGKPGGDKPDDPAPTGRLRIIKEIVNTTSFPTPASQFRITVSCKPSPDASYTPSAPAGMDQYLTIAAGAECTVTEADPPLLPRPCRWERSYPGGQTGRNGATVIVRNTLVCPG